MDQVGLAESVVGRAGELAMIRALLDRATRNGEALVVFGEAGVGKTTLLDAAAAIGAENGTHVLRASGVEFEADVSYFSLNQLLLPLHALFEELGDTHRTALRVALGFGEGPAPGRLVLSNATLALLRRASARGSLLVVIDDLPWIDRASAGVLGFVARRLNGTRIGFLAAARTGVGSFFERTGLPEHELRSLDDDAARSLLDGKYPMLAPGVRERLLSEAQGNPLALVELPAALSDPERAALRSLPALLPLSRRLLALFASRVEELPAPTRRLMLLAALDGTGDLRVLEAEDARHQGLERLQAAETAHLAHVDPRTRQLAFRHPLIRTAVVELSTSHQRRRAHAALAELWSDEPDRRAWHLAEAAVGPDAEVARLLDDAAQRVLLRGDAVSAVAAWTRAAELSTSAPDRARRLAQAAYVGAEEAGELGNAAILLADARRADPLVGGSLHAAAAAVFLLINGDGDVNTAHRLLVGAIETGEHNYDASNDALIEALHNLMLVCWFGSRAELWEPFYAAYARLDPGPPDILSVMSKTWPDPVRTAAAGRAEFDVLAATIEDESDPTRIMRFGTASVYADRLGDAREGAWRLVKQGREGGPARRHLGSLQHLCLDDFLTGRWDEGEQLADEGLAVCEAHGYRFFAWYFLYQKAILAAVRGEHGASLALADRMTRWATPRGVRSALLFAEHARTLSALGRGDYEEAYQRASFLSPAGTLASHIPHALWVALDMVEATTRTGRQREAAAHVEAMIEADVASISPRMALLVAGCAGIAAADRSANEHFDRALSTPGADHWPFELARVRLAYGECLRRSRAASESRRYLTAAEETFQRLGARPWAARARNELRASGPTKPRADEYDRDELTPQEREIALLAAEGLTSKQIAQRLFISPRTVSTHLYRLFPKLGVSSRAGLRDALASLPAEPEHEVK
ncbi:MAG TPA: AAA family ATPase [Solirubrobacteraceae bacterium]|nr:AAA family ATPase [Solirubrobacteraceae bacterium]